MDFLELLKTRRSVREEVAIMPFYKGPAGFERFMNIFMNLVICVGMATLILAIVQAQVPEAPIFTPIAWLCMLLESFAFGFTVITLLPVSNWANAVASKVEGKIGSYVVQAIVFDIAMTTVMSLLISLVDNIQTHGLEGTFASWLGVFPYALIVAFFIILVFMAPSQALAAKLSGFDPRKAR